MIFLYKEDYLDPEYGKEAYNELCVLINNLGYFISGKTKETDPGQYINIVIIPKYITEVTEYVYKENNGVLYHITPKKNKDKILLKRLIPRHWDKQLDQYPDRIYFYLEKHYKNIDTLCKDLSKNTAISEWIVLKLDLKDKRSYKDGDKSTMYRFFDDPKSKMGIFTYENIDPIYLYINR